MNDDERLEDVFNEALNGRDWIVLMDEDRDTEYLIQVGTPADGRLMVQSDRAEDREQAMRQIIDQIETF